MEGLKGIVNGLKITTKEKITVYYPSTEFLDKPDADFSEYMKAKHDGEDLCHRLQSENNNIRFVVSRLPRLKTDQQQSIIPNDAQFPQDVMLNEMIKMTNPNF